MRLHHRLTVPLLSLCLLLPTLAGCAASREDLTDSEPEAVVKLPARPRHRRAIVLSCDGGGDAFIDKMIAAGHMPNLAALRQKGLVADYARTSFPSKTAPGHASIWTGAYQDRHGIVANHVPRLPATEHTLNSHLDGFDAEALQAEPVWAAAARQGKRVVLVQATHTTPMETYQPGGKYGDISDKLRIVDFYKGQMGRNTHRAYGSDVPTRPAADWKDAPAGSLALDLPGEDGTGSLPALLADDPADPRVGFDTLAVSPHRRWQGAIKLKPGKDGRFSPAVPWPDSDGRRAFLRLWELSADGRHFLLTRTPLSKQVVNRPDLPSQALGAVAGGPEKLYADHGFGPTVLAGGDGTAEARYVECVGQTLDNRLAVARRLLRSPEDWDLACVYAPFPDAALHMWAGLLDPASPHYRPAAAALLENALTQVAAKLDRFIGDLAAIEPSAALAVVSDHGLDAVHWDFYPNVLLARAGLLAYLPNGEIDLSRTRVMYPVHDPAALVVNRINRKGGIVTEREVPHLLERAKRALLAAKDPRTGKSVVTAFYEPDPAFGNTAYGDLYMDLLPGYYFHPRTIAPGWWAPRHPFMSGGHIFHPERRTMHAMFAFAGPDIPARALGPIRTIDAIPTVCDYLGIAPPKDAAGRSLLPSPVTTGGRP